MFPQILSRRAHALSATVAVLGAAIVTAGPAQAQTQAIASPMCSSVPTVSQPFAGWGDTNDYWLVPGSDFAGGAPGWTLTGGAAVESGGAPFSPPGAPSSTGSLALPAGATAISPSFCIDATQPTFRFLSGGSADSVVNVSVDYQTPARTYVVPAGTVVGGQWQPSPALQTYGQIATTLLHTTATMSVQFTGVTGTGQIEDLFIDPRMSHG